MTTTQEVNRLDVTLTNHGLDAVLRELMDENEEGRYDLYNGTYGNRDYLFDTETLPGGGGDFGYEIPAEALTDQKFANMIHEAEKYLGYPYVWGGSSPSTSFDCSGFVSWVINNCGNGWNIGRQTTDGLMGYCSRVSPSEACGRQYDDPLRKSHSVYKHCVLLLAGTFPGIWTYPRIRKKVSGMNRKLHRVLDEIQRTEKKIAEWQEHLKELKLLAEQLENQEIVKTIRSMKLDSHRMLELLEGIQSGTVSIPLPEQEETKESSKEQTERIEKAQESEVRNHEET